jgi:hypothetical protein
MAGTLQAGKKEAKLGNTRYPQANYPLKPYIRIFNFDGK